MIAGRTKTVSEPELVSSRSSSEKSSAEEGAYRSTSASLSFEGEGECEASRICNPAAKKEEQDAGARNVCLLKRRGRVAFDPVVEDVRNGKRPLSRRSAGRRITSVYSANLFALVWASIVRS